MARVLMVLAVLQVEPVAVVVAAAKESCALQELVVEAAVVQREFFHKLLRSASDLRYCSC